MSTTVTVVVRAGRARPSRPWLTTALAVLFVAWVMGWLWWLLAAAAVCAVTITVQRWMQSAAAQNAALAARADQQHAWVLAGDPRGTYGVQP